MKLLAKNMGYKQMYKGLKSPLKLKIDKLSETESLETKLTSQVGIRSERSVPTGRNLWAINDHKDWNVPQPKIKGGQLQKYYSIVGMINVY